MATRFVVLKQASVLLTRRFFGISAESLTNLLARGVCKLKVWWVALVQANNP